MSQNPQRVRHQQSGVQLHSQLNGLRTLSGSLRRIGADDSGGLLDDPGRAPLSPLPRNCVGELLGGDCPVPGRRSDRKPRSTLADTFYGPDRADQKTCSLGVGHRKKSLRRCVLIKGAGAWRDSPLAAVKGGSRPQGCQLLALRLPSSF
jgi:hypothetical protein